MKISPSGNRNPRRFAVGFGAVAVTSALVLTGCATDSADGPTTVTIAVVANPQMEDLEKLSAVFEEENPDINVEFAVLPADQLKDNVTKDIATKAGQYDLVMLGPDQGQLWANLGWLENLSPFAAEDAAYDIDDIIPSVRDSLSLDGDLYVAPFYAEGGMLAYREDLFEAAGLVMPERPTWDEVAEFAAALNVPGETAGICLRGVPNSGGSAMTLITMMDAFGGALYDMDWKATVSSPEATAATEMYIDLITNYGEPGASTAGFNECLTSYAQGQSAMWYDATVASSIIEDPESSAIVGKSGYVLPPTAAEKEAVSFYWSWGIGMPTTSDDKDAAWKFLSWATSKDYISLVGEELGYVRIPPGTRLSTYEIPEYLAEGEAFAQITLDSIAAVDIVNPGPAERPYKGGGWMDIAEGPNLETQFAQEITAIITGDQDIPTALAKIDKIFNESAIATGLQK
ncbi:sugar ABC transporter substrate-binding protein [soil metagenome]